MAELTAGDATVGSEEGLLLTVNAGSSSIRVGVFCASLRVVRGKIDQIGNSANGVVSIHGQHGEELVRELLIPATHERATDWLISWVSGHFAQSQLLGVVHRIVHGGREFREPIILNGEILRKLRSLVPLAPLHQVQNLLPVEILLRRMPSVRQVACFDTAFHRTLPLKERMYALPQEWFRAGVQRYGFHGLSYEGVARVLPALCPRGAAGRSIVCHLGSGASMCALQNGESVATTMGFTPLDGLPMGTRCGSLDPGVVLYLLAEKGMSIPTVQRLLYEQSGLLGLSERSADMRELLASEEESARAAIEVYCYRAAREIGSLVAALGGLDCLIFTGGIGENSPRIRRCICELSSWLGIMVDGDANEGNSQCISRMDSALPVLVVNADEEAVMAAHGYAALR